MHVDCQPATIRAVAVQISFAGGSENSAKWRKLAHSVAETVRVFRAMGSWRCPFSCSAAA